MTFLESQTAVSELINQALSGDTLTVTLTEVKRNLNIAYKQVVSAVITANQDYYMEEGKADLVSGQSRYALPTDCKRLSRLEISYDGTTYYRATPMSVNSVDDVNMTFSATEPFYYLVGNDFVITPSPSADVTDGMKLWYLENVVDLTDNTDLYDIPLGYEHLPVLYATAMAKKKLGMIEEGNDLILQFKEGLMRMTDEIAPRKEDEAEMVVVRDYISDSSF